jgi:protein-S-isoprenylcysteine O-methyltransferase Ste14
VAGVRVRAWTGTLVFLVVAPGVVAGLVPWAITGWRFAWTGAWVVPVATVGAVLIGSGVVVLLDAFVRFARADGTPAPPVPTGHLVVVGPYRYVRNPMYLAVLAIVLGQSLLSGSRGALVYAAVVLVAVALFVRGYEEPTLEARYGEEYRTYRHGVRGWVPRLRPWDRATTAEVSASGTPSPDVRRRRTGGPGPPAPTRRGTPGSGGP